MTARTRKQSEPKAEENPATVGSTDADSAPPAGSIGSGDAYTVQAETPGSEGVPSPQEVQAEVEAAVSEDDGESDSGYQYLNVSGGPLVYDEDGHQVDADAWTPKVNLDSIGRRHRDSRYLLPRSAL